MAAHFKERRARLIGRQNLATSERFLEAATTAAAMSDVGATALR